MQLKNTNRRSYASKQEAAKYAGVSVRTIDKLLAQGLLKRYAVGRAVRIDLNEFDAYMSGR